MYRLFFEPAAFRIFKKLPPDVKGHLKEQAAVLAHDPLQGEQLKGKHRLLRSLHTSYKGTAYRIIYQVITQSETVLIRLADKRENIYKRLEHMGI